MNATRVIQNLIRVGRRSGQFVLCQYEQRTGVDDYGAPQYAAPVEIDAMWLAEQSRVRNAEGEEVLTEGKLWVPTEYPVTRIDRITLPDGTQPTVISVNAHASGSDFTHYEVFF